MALRGISIDASSQTIPSPTFTGTVTFPDGSTWTSTGVTVLGTYTGSALFINSFDAVLQLRVGNGATAGATKYARAQVIANETSGLELFQTSSTYNTANSVLTDPINVASAGQVISGRGGGLVLGAANGPLQFYCGSYAAASEKGRIETTGSWLAGVPSLATSATDGFLYIPTTTNTPTGVPTAKTGRIAMVYDTTNHQFWFYDGAWKQPKTPAGAALVTWQ